MKNLLPLKLAFAVAVVFLLDVGGAQAQMVRLDPMNDSIAIGIDNLIVNGTPYNVTFPLALPFDQYGGPPPVSLDFHTEAAAVEAAEAVNAALNGVPTATRVGDPRLPIPIPTAFFLIGYEYVANGNDLRTANANYDSNSNMWFYNRVFTASSTNVQTWASFDVVPEPGTGLLLGLGLAGVAACTRRSGQWLVWP